MKYIVYALALVMSAFLLGIGALLISIPLAFFLLIKDKAEDEVEKINPEFRNKVAYWEGYFSEKFKNVFNK